MRLFGPALALVVFVACDSDPEGILFPPNECRVVDFGFDFRPDVAGERGVTEHEPSALEVEVQDAQGTLAIDRDDCTGGGIAEGTLTFDTVGEAAVVVRVEGREIDRFSWSVHEITGLAIVDGGEESVSDPHEVPLGRDRTLVALPLADGRALATLAGASWSVDDPQVLELRDLGGEAMEGAADGAFVMVRGLELGETTVTASLVGFELSMAVRVVEAEP